MLFAVVLLSNDTCSCVNYEYVPTQTISPQGAKTVWVRCASKTKERVTIMLLGDSDSKKLNPFPIFKTKPSKGPTPRERTRRRAVVLADSFGQSWSRFNVKCRSTATPPLGGTASYRLLFLATTS
ncbi:hypothetical protein PHYPSEUDO_000136 [Phytophthora pseudosyringae]|uniref:Uncharacterized protein n=1 Tax=Phytophthora pseudosyringae TaxID=221518 RepID=A0A8T1WQF9_9STRA|nr:hypothetical protein PHYPSEUDO_000136 [Phytophthora pseudosyringae]